MAKNEVVVRTAQDLEKKYNFAALLGLKKNVEITAQGMLKIENELNSMLNALVINLKDVLDSQSEISLWFYSGKPTTSNAPYTTWTTPSDHVGDIYYDQSTGYVYQYKEVKGKGLWEINSSPDLVEAMAITNAETDTSTDHERKVFFNTPTIPYSNGDWWIKDDGSLFICQISKTSGTYETADFIDSSKYTESIAEKIGEEIQVLKGTVTMITENYAKFTDLATGGSTTISGDNITTGSIQSNNYIKDVSGTKIALTDGTIDAKNFKVDSKGNVTMTSANITNGVINSPNFKVDSNGNMTCKSATAQDLSVVNGNFNIISTRDVPRMTLKYPNTNNIFATFDGFGWATTNNETSGYTAYANSGFGYGSNGEFKPVMTLARRNTSTNNFLLSTTIEDGKILLTNFNNTNTTQQSTMVQYDRIITPILSQTSLKEQKKNFKKLENALQIIKDTDIYKYNLIFEEDDNKKHIGFVIGDDFNYSHDITSIDENKKEIGVDTYSMVSVCFQAIKEQQEMIEKLKEEIQILKEG